MAEFLEILLVCLHDLRFHDVNRLFIRLLSTQYEKGKGLLQQKVFCCCSQRIFTFSDDFLEVKLYPSNRTNAATAATLAGGAFKADRRFSTRDIFARFSCG